MSVADQPKAMEEEGGSRWWSCCVPNMTMLPLKLVIFFFSSSAFSILPYLTIHMKDIGISVESIAIIYAVLPFTSLFSSPLVGFLADKLGSYTKVLMMSVTGDAIFFSLLLLIPKVKYVVHEADVTFTMASQQANFQWAPCTELATLQTNFNQSQLFLSDCDLSCPFDVGANPCSAFANGPNFCSYSGLDLTLSNISWTNMELSSEPNQAAYRLHDNGGALVELALGCDIQCPVLSQSELVQCSHVVGDPVLTNVLYFILRGLANICLGCNFLLIDAQTIQMCKREEELGRSGEIGRQYVYSAIAQAAISPVVGKLMDFVSTQSESGEPNYVVPFVGNVVFLSFTLFMVCKIKLDVDLPKSTSLSGLKKIFANVDIVVFLVLTFVTGACWGFVETFLFVYLKDDMGAPMYLLGLTITVGAIVSIPFLIGADWIVRKVGRWNVFISTLFIYAIRYIGYSYITNPWMSFPFEGLEVFTNTLFRVASVRYIGEVAPEGLLATLNGLVGGLHYGMGKGMGSLLGGAIIAATRSTSFAFRLFGIASAVFGVIITVYEYCFSKYWRTKPEEEHEKSRRVSERVILPETQGFLAEQFTKLGSVTSIERAGEAEGATSKV